MVPAVRWHCPDCQVTLGRYVHAFVSCYGSGRRHDGGFDGVSGRVLRGVSEADFASLTADPQRRVVFMLDEAAMGDLVGLDGWQILRRIGYDDAFVQGLLARGTVFRLAVVRAGSALPATWRNLLDLVAAAYPAWEDRIARARPFLVSRSYEEIMAQGGTPAEVRRFLEIRLNVNRQFAGDGYTRRLGADGEPIWAEYVTVNQRLDDLGAYALISLPLWSD